MATNYWSDKRAAAIRAYFVNHSEYKPTLSNEGQWWLSARGLSAIPYGVDRDTAIQAAATAFGITLTSTSPWEREEEFWPAYQSLPPTPLA